MSYKESDREIVRYLLQMPSSISDGLWRELQCNGSVFHTTAALQYICHKEKVQLSHFKDVSQIKPECKLSLLQKRLHLDSLYG